MRTFSKLALMLFTALCFSSLTELKAQFSFTPSNFTVVDRTINIYSPNQSSFVPYLGGNANCYRLTGAIADQKSAIILSA